MHPASCCKSQSCQDSKGNADISGLSSAGNGHRVTSFSLSLFLSLPLSPSLSVSLPSLSPSLSPLSLSPSLSSALFSLSFSLSLPLSIRLNPSLYPSLSLLFISVSLRLSPLSLFSLSPSLSLPLSLPLSLCLSPSLSLYLSLRLSPSLSLSHSLSVSHPLSVDFKDANQHYLPHIYCSSPLISTSTTSGTKANKHLSISQNSNNNDFVSGKSPYLYNYIMHNNNILD